MQRIHTAARQGERGAALVEFALILPIFMTLVLGLFSGGIAYNQKLSLTHAAREGARYGATVPATQTWDSGTWASNVRDLVVDRSAGELSGSGAVVCVALVEGSSDSATSPLTVVTPATDYSTTGAPCIGDETYNVTPTDAGRRVQVSVSRPSEIELLFFDYDLTLRARGTARAESTS